jgi:multidrug efflux pump subunit AcrA (membrane-fusion protein)
MRAFVGTVRSRTSAAVQCNAVGHVLAVHVVPGDRVEAQQLLIEIDDRDAAAGLRMAEAGLAEAKRALDEVERALAAAASTRDAAIAERDLARATFDRQRNLLDKNVISKQVFDEAEAQLKATTASAEAAEQSLKAVEAKRGQAVAAVEQAASALDAARVRLSYTRVTAPFAGLISGKSVDVGDLASPGMTLLTLEDDQRYRLEANVDIASAGPVAVGSPVSVEVDGLDSRSIEGTVAEIVPTADPSSRTFTIKIDLPFHEGMRSGMFGRARFAAGQTRTLSVPKSAVTVRGQLTGLYIVDGNGVAKLRLVKTGRSLGDGVEVLSGLSEGERYIAEVPRGIADGSRVTPQG